jgi:AcrR family transcriptional regulator
MKLTKKDIIARTLLNIASDVNSNLTIEEISKRTNISRLTIKKNFKNGISDIIEYVYSGIIEKITKKLITYDITKLTLENFSDILLPIVWGHRDMLHIIYTSKFAFRIRSYISSEMLTWLGPFINKLLKKHRIISSFSAIELLEYFNSYLTSVLILWLSPKIPLNVELFKPKFLFLMNNSLENIFYNNFSK